MKNKLILTTFLLFNSLALAENTYRQKIFGVSKVKEIIPKHGDRQKNARHDIRLVTYLPDLGRIVLKLDRQKAREVTPTFTDEFGNVTIDTSPIVLLRGKLETNSESMPLAASIFEINNAPTLKLSFRGKNSRFDTHKLYELKVNLESDQSIAEIRKIHERSLALKKLGCGADESFQIGSSSNNHQRTAPFSTLPVCLYNKVQLNLDGDAELYDIFGSSANANISDWVNTAEVFYENDLCITYQIVRQNVFLAKSFGSSDADNKLTAYQNYTNSQSYQNSADGHKLLTGVEIAGGTIGLAYVGVICYPGAEDYRYGLSQYTNAAVTATTFAHEVGHMFGGEHQSSGIMTAFLSDPPPTSFSSASITEIGNYVSTYNSCLTTTSSTSDSDDATPGETGDDGGGGDGGGTPDGDSGSQLLMSVNLKKSGLITFSFSTDADLSIGCTLTLKGATSSAKLSDGGGLVVFTKSLTSLTDTIQGTVSKKTEIYNASGSVNKAYFRAYVVCGDYDDYAESDIIARKSSKPVNNNIVSSVTKWLKEVRSKLQQ